MEKKVLGSVGEVCTTEILLDQSWLKNPQEKGILALIVIIINESYEGK